MTTPLEVVSDEAATPQRLAAASSSICRPAAPTWRIGIQFIGVAKLPPAIWKPYLRASLSAW